MEQSVFCVVKILRLQANLRKQQFRYVIRWLFHCSIVASNEWLVDSAQWNYLCSKLFGAHEDSKGTERYAHSKVTRYLMWAVCTINIVATALLYGKIFGFDEFGNWWLTSQSFTYIPSTVLTYTYAVIFEGWKKLNNRTFLDFMLQCL